MLTQETLSKLDKSTHLRQKFSMDFGPRDVKSRTSSKQKALESLIIQQKQKQPVYIEPQDDVTIALSNPSKVFSLKGELVTKKDNFDTQAYNQTNPLSANCNSRSQSNAMH